MEMIESEKQQEEVANEENIKRTGSLYASHSAAVQQTVPHIPKKQRQMSRTAARDNGNFPICLLGPAIAA
mgnify:CR=1 FL=1